MAPGAVQTGMRTDSSSQGAFSLVELLVVVAVIAILAALLLSGISAAHRYAMRAPCLNNLKQIDTGVEMYADDHNGLLPIVRGNGPPALWSDYALFVRSYLGLKGTPSPKDRVFVCPADTFSWVDSAWPYISEAIHLQSRFRFNSYAFNAANSFTMYSPATGHVTSPGIAGSRMSSVQAPAKTVLVFDFPAMVPYSWHQPVRKVPACNSRDMVSFVDGHASFTKIYWDAKRRGFAHCEAWNYDPPPGYDYKWSGTLQQPMSAGR